MFVGNILRTDAPDVPAVCVHTAPAGPVIVTTPLLGDATTVENVSEPKMGAVKVMLGTDVGGIMLNAGYRIVSLMLINHNI